MIGTRKFSRIFPVNVYQNPDQCITEKIISINTIYHSVVSTVYIVWISVSIEEINTYTDSDADTIQIVEKKKGQSLGLLLQFNETERVAYINDIVDNSITSFLVGDQITHINDARVTSIKKISAIVGSIETGKDIVFKVKRPKKQNQRWKWNLEYKQV